MPFMSPTTAVTTNLSVMARFTAILHSTDSVDSIGRDQPPGLAYSFVVKNPLPLAQGRASCICYAFHTCTDQNNSRGGGPASD